MPASFGPPQPPPNPWTGDILKDASNLFAGWADKLTFGITSQIRQVFGYDDVIDYNSAAYHTGAAIGSLHNSLLMVTPGAAGGILGTVQKALNTAGQVGGAMSVIEAFQAGDLLAAVEGVVSIGLASVRGVTACQRASRVAQWGQRALHGVAAARAIDAAYGNFNRGDYLGGFVHLVDAGTNAYMMGCFAAGTPIRTPSGHKNIEDFEVGDEILSRNEYDPEGPIEVQRVEERFVRVAKTKEIRVDGRVDSSEGDLSVVEIVERKLTISRKYRRSSTSHRRTPAAKSSIAVLSSPLSKTAYQCCGLHEIALAEASTQFTFRNKVPRSQSNRKQPRFSFAHRSLDRQGAGRSSKASAIRALRREVGEEAAIIVACAGFHCRPRLSCLRLWNPQFPTRRGCDPT